MDGDSGWGRAGEEGTEGGTCREAGKGRGGAEDGGTCRALWSSIHCRSHQPTCPLRSLSPPYPCRAAYNGESLPFQLEYAQGLGIRERERGRRGKGGRGRGTGNTGRRGEGARGGCCPHPGTVEEQRPESRYWGDVAEEEASGLKGLDVSHKVLRAELAGMRSQAAARVEGGIGLPVRVETNVCIPEGRRRRISESMALSLNEEAKKRRGSGQHELGMGFIQGEKGGAERDRGRGIRCTCEGLGRKGRRGVAFGVHCPSPPPRGWGAAQLRSQT